MERALVEFRSQAAQRDRFVQMLLDVAADCFHHLGLAVAADRFGTAAQAGTVAGFLGFVRLAEESNVFPARTPRRARRTAIDSGGGDGKDESAVLIGIAGQNCLPPIVVAQRHLPYFGLIVALRHVVRLRSD